MKAGRGRRVQATFGKAFSFDFQSVGRILDAVDKEHGAVPERFALPDQNADPNAFKAARSERLRLGVSIRAAVHAWQVAALREDAGRQRTRQRNAAHIEKTATKLAKLLDASGSTLRKDPVLHEQLEEGPFHTEPMLSELGDMLEELMERAAKAAATAKAVAENPPVLSGGLSGTPAFHRRLVEIYERAFERQIVMPTNTEGEPFGPFVAFVRAIRDEVGAPAEPPSVAEALKRAGWDPKQSSANGRSLFVTHATASRSVSVRGQERPSRATGRNASGKADGAKDSCDGRGSGRAVGPEPNAAL